VAVRKAAGHWLVHALVPIRIGVADRRARAASIAR
jgi:hypothetical protein